MKKGTLFKRLGVLAALVTLANVVQGQQFTGHYPAGAEGIKAASLPPPGLYLRDYNIFYDASINKDSGLADFDATVYVQAPRLIWITDWKIPGINAQYGMDLLVPFYYSDVKFKGPGGGTFKDDTFAMGDLQFEPLLLAWHGKQFDVGAGYAFWAPSGDTSDDLSRPARLLSRGYWGHMLTLGATWFPTEDRTWAISLLNRYEINMDKDIKLGGQDYELTPGNAYTLEWGISKSITKTIDLGVVGYYQQQTTDDTGSAIAILETGGYRQDRHDRVFGVGPEISTFCPKLGLFTSLRYLREFGAKDGPEGNKVTLTLTRRF